LETGLAVSAEAGHHACWMTHQFSFWGHTQQEGQHTCTQERAIRLCTQPQTGNLLTVLSRDEYFWQGIVYNSEDEQEQQIVNLQSVPSRPYPHSAPNEALGDQESCCHWERRGHDEEEPRGFRALLPFYFWVQGDCTGLFALSSEQRI
jgi:hypothetical protein